MTSHAQDYPAGACIPSHRHARAQLLYAAAGTMTVTAESGSWVIPADRALWIPPGVGHAIRVGAKLAMRTLYVAPGAAAGLPRQCRVLQVTPLLRELVLAATALGARESGSRARRIRALILDELRQIPAMPLYLPTARSARLQKVTTALAADPADRRTLGQWAREAGMSPRNLARAFLKETGLGFRLYRRQARLLAALERLAAGRPVTGVALDLGYDSSSAFIAMFRRALAATPKRYFGTAASPGRA